MIRRILLGFGLLGVVLASGAQADSAFWLRNTDAGALFVYWTVPAGSMGPGTSWLAGLPLAPGGRHDVVSGERVRVTLPGSHVLVGVFIPLDSGVTALTPVSGGELLPSEVPSQGTVQLDRPGFAAFNRGRSLDARLQAWGLEVPQMRLGSPEPWSSLHPLFLWGSSFRPAGHPWPPGWPQVKTLQAVDREGALWVRLTTEGPGFPVTEPIALALRRSRALWSIPLTGKPGIVWSWEDGHPPLPVGWSVSSPQDYQARIPWDRLPEGTRDAWEAGPWVWSLVVTQGDSTMTWDLGQTSLGEWP